MAELAWLLEEHVQTHPAMEVRDAVKFLCQSHLGSGHLVHDEESALACLEEEWSRTPKAPASPLSQPLGNGLCRLDLGACKGRGLSCATYGRLFLLTAQAHRPDPEGLSRDLELVRPLFPPEEAAAFLSDYRARGCPPIHHSEAYRNTYSPAYRVVFSYFAGLVPLLAEIDRLMEQHPRLRVAIDGPCASGKSTLGRALSQVYRCPLVHMDDYFLRPEQRLPERLAEPGGNVDYERFQSELLAPMLSGQPALCRPWVCREGHFGPETWLDPAPLTVVEGVYSLRPGLREAWHLRVWLEAPWPVRRARLLDRGGPGCLSRFEDQWIPLEERYFAACRVKECCQIQFP